jgi:RHS repeat-associated protein
MYRIHSNIFTTHDRYLYQGSEMDKEIKGDGNSYTTTFRQLDPRLGRWFSIDPVVQHWQSVYCSMDNNPIKLNDIKGDKIIIRNTWKDKEGNWHEFKVTYKRGKLYDSSGEVYTPEKGGFIEKVYNDLNQLKKDSDRAKNVVNRLDNSSKTHIITNHVFERPADENRGNYNVGTFEIGSITKYEAFKNTNIVGQRRDPRVGLIHELTHAWDHDMNQGYKFNTRIGGVKLSEIHAVNVENTIRERTGDPKRVDYSGTLIPSNYLN